MKICKVKGCSGKHKSKGYCKKHYAQLLTYNKILERIIFDPNEIIIKGNIAEIVLYNIKCEEIDRAIIDSEDVKIIKKHKWCKDSLGYVATGSSGRLRTRIQHYIMGIKANKNHIIDHKDRNKLNNRKSNFRFCTNAENLRNRPKSSNNKSGFKGVFWSNQNKSWQSQIGINGKSIHLGGFEDKRKAAIAYNIAATKYFGEFAYLNEV